MPGALNYMEPPPGNDLKKTSRATTRGHRGTTSLSQPERRRMTRLPLEVFLRMRVSGLKEIQYAETRDVSARGIYFFTRAQVETGQELECVLVLPEELTLAPRPMFVGCRGKVLRTNERLPGQKLGVAVEIQSYDFSLPGSFAENSAWV